ncbi:uncharacterized protein MELLADRAFT_50391 [Melampsora larici-populina 98AG31]|uniref:UDP-galactose transporter n=1 Tax=Melampsora larici-populina (strain 98AG31 / pathotype 3-4-7) TaxID=747676 RepID=F4S4J0_MELLP|nr:uncharacterized protein MELLADRAFT_50391 [Melampsora larici-populina 98AG31]EGG00418.1 hypothetical protein MELLADRAFT_50391 [Melampsora larici-populina 98AG31]
MSLSNHSLHLSNSSSNHLNLCGIPIKYLSLITLTLQNSLLTILCKFILISPAAVLLNEILKCLISLTIAIYNSSTSFSTDTRSDDKVGQLCSRDCWKLSIPAILYVIQNNLQFVAASHLDVATFSVTYQLKILTTALCSVLMLGRRLSTYKWVSLFFLAIGVALVQVQNTPSAPPKDHPSNFESTDRLIGFIAVTAACFTSGLAGVYFELVLKSSTKVDLWIRNVQLSIFSLLPALFTAFYYSSNSQHHGLFDHFGWAAWATVLTQVMGGLVTALVIKFADNILKGFATSLSIILSTFASVILFNAPLPLGSVIGASVVLLATYSYNHPVAADRPTSLTGLPIRMPPKIPTWRDHSGNKKEDGSVPFSAPLGIGISLHGIDSIGFGNTKYSSAFPSLQFNPLTTSSSEDKVLSGLMNSNSRGSSDTIEHASGGGSPARYLMGSAHSRGSASRENDEDLELDEKMI